METFWRRGRSLWAQNIKELGFAEWRSGRNKNSFNI
jgi:hypothetical protein